MFLVGLKVAGTKENKSFMGFVLGHVFVAGACGANAVSVC